MYLYDFFNKNENNINEGDRMMVSGGWTDSKGNWSAAYVIKNTQNSMELVGVGGDNDVTVKTLVSGDSTTMIYRIAIAI